MEREKVHQLFTDDGVSLVHHPTVRTATRVVGTAAARERRKEVPDGRPRARLGGRAVPSDFAPVKPVVSIEDALSESLRCLKCAEAPCTQFCPVGVDVRSFMYNISKQNYYNAARHIYSDNPLGLACGVLCDCPEQCQKPCTLRNSAQGSIKIGALQQFACDVYQKMDIPEIRDPKLPPLNELPESYSTPIALVGAGPASISCATFLLRVGYTNLTIFDREAFPGGVPAFSIPSHRLSYSCVTSELASLLRSKSVKFVGQKELGKDGFTLQKLRDEDKFGLVFVAVGLPRAFDLPALKPAYGATNVWQYQDFLGQISRATKPLGGNALLPNFAGLDVLILGGGDCAYNCASAAYRCGAKRVTMAMRRKFRMPGSMIEFEACLERDVLILPTFVPYSVEMKDGMLAAVVLKKHWHGDEQAAQIEASQTMTVNCDVVVVALGGAMPMEEAVAPLVYDERGRVKYDPRTMQADSSDWMFVGGDFAGSTCLVEAVNDGKVAAWSMHCRLQGLDACSVPRSLPMLYTEADLVDLSVEFCGMKFLNPFGLSSATPTGSVGMIKRAFEMGWAFAVTKTITFDKDIATNVSPRIVRQGSSRLHGCDQIGFHNIELTTEKTLLYWIEGIQHLKAEFPAHIVIASIMACSTEDWRTLAKEVVAAGPDALELNLSCPHIGRSGFGMLAGQDEEKVTELTAAVRDAVGPDVILIVKLTPNITDIATIACAAVEGGANALTAINTVAGLSNVRSSGAGWPTVGSDGLTAFGGVSGNIIRPIALKAVATVRQHLPSIPILGCGGIDSGEGALQMIHAGADVIQVCSAIQNQDFSIIDELLSGLRVLVYMKARQDLREWEGQVPPAGAQLASADALPAKPGPIPSLASLKSKVVPTIKVVPELNYKEQAVAVADLEQCVGCGKCMMACNDTGYQAIVFDSVKRVPEFTLKCMGCGLCGSVCPTSCISYVPKEVPHTVCRGIPNPNLQMPFDP